MVKSWRHVKALKVLGQTTMVIADTCNFANDQDYYNHFVGLIGRSIRAYKVHVSASLCSGIAQVAMQTRTTQSIGKMYNAVNKVVGARRSAYMERSGPTTAILQLAAIVAEISFECDLMLALPR